MKRFITPLLIIVNLILITAVSVPKLQASSTDADGLKNCCEDETCCIQCCIFAWNCFGPGPC